MNNTFTFTFKRLGYSTLSSIGYFLLWAQWRTKSVSGTGFSESCTIASSSSAEKNQCINFWHLKSIALFISAFAFNAFVIYLYLAFRMHFRWLNMNASLLRLFLTDADILGGLGIGVQWVGWCNMVIWSLPV